MYSIPFSIYASQKKLKGALICFLLLAAAMIWFLYAQATAFSNGEDYYPQAFLVAPVAVGYFLYLSARKWRSLRYNGPMLTISEGGIEIFTPGFEGMGLVSWSDITGCSEVKMGMGEMHLQILVANPEMYNIKIASEKDRARHLKRSGGGKAVLWLNLEAADCNVLELKKAIFKIINKYQAVHRPAK